MATEAQRKKFLKYIGPKAKRDYQKTGVLASVTIAQAILESGWGTSKLATEGKNLFGIKASPGDNYIIMSTQEENAFGIKYWTTAKFKKYSSWDASIADHSNWLIKNGYGLEKITNYISACDTLQKKGYATDSGYASLLKTIIASNKLYQYDKKSSTVTSANNVTNKNIFVCWKQYDSRWGNILLGSGSNTTMSRIGCLATTVANIIQMTGKAPSGFNPGTFVQKMKKLGGFTSGGGYVNMVVGKTGFVSDFRQECTTYLSSNYTQSQKRTAIRSYLKKGYYVAVNVASSTSPRSGHWVACTDVSNNIAIADPGGNKTDLTQHTVLTEIKLFACPSAPFSGVTISTDNTTTGNTGTSETKVNASVELSNENKFYEKQVIKYLYDKAKDKPTRSPSVKSVKYEVFSHKQASMKSFTLCIIHGKYKVYPVVVDDITLSLERRGVPGQLQFTYLADKKSDITEGDAVHFRWNKNKVFFGFVFEKKRSEDGTVKVTCYDQLRYLKNKDTYVLKNKSADEVIKMIAEDFGLRTGTLEKTGYKVKKRIEDDKTLFDIINDFLDITLRHQKKLFVLYDGYGKLTLKNAASMKLNLLIDEQTSQTYSYSTSINGDTYNKIKLTYSNKETASREIYIAKDSTNIMKWGVLQYTEKVTSEKTNMKSKAKKLLSLYNDKERSLTISGCFGDTRVVPGCSVVVMMEFDDIKVANYMMVEKVTHKFSDTLHMMNLTLRGAVLVD